VGEIWHGFGLCPYTMGLPALSPICSAQSLYRPRNPRKTALYQLMEAHYEDVKASWEDRFEKTYGRWRGFVDQVVWRYLDCGIPESGFARLRCEACHDERLLCFSCRQRGICPSCSLPAVALAKAGGQAVRSVPAFAATSKGLGAASARSRRSLDVGGCSPSGG
jgi:ribosomal protein S27E